MATIRGLTIEIGGETTKLTTALGEVNAKARDVQSELRQVERLLKLDPGNTELVAQKQKILSESVENTKKKLEQLKEAERQAQEQFKEGKISEEQYRAIQREVIKTEQELQKLNKTIAEADWIALGNKLEDLGGKATKIGKDMSLKVTAPILGVGAAAVKIGMDFEEGLSKVKAMSGATEEEMIRLENSAREAGAATSKSATDATDALGFMALAGWSVNDSVEGLMPVLRLAEAGQIDLGRASSLVTDSMSAMGIEVQDLNHYLDIVAQTARSSNTDIDQMAEAYVKVGGTLRGLNIPLEESALALGFLANNGIKGAEAGTALNAILTNITAPTGRAKDALEDLGYTAFDTEGNFYGLEVVLDDLAYIMEGMTTEQRNMYLSMLGGKEHVKGLNALLNGMSDSYDELSNSISDADGALEEVALTMQDNNKGALTELASALEELALKIYDVLQPVIEDMIVFIQGLVDSLNGMSPEMQKTIVVLAGLAAAIGPVLIVIGKMSTGVGAIIKLLAPLTAGLGGATGATGVLGAAFAAITGPIGIAVVAITGLIAIAVALYKNFDSLSDFTSKAWEGIKNTINKMGELIKADINKLKDNINNIWTSMTNFVSDKWGNLWTGLINGLTGYASSITTAVKGIGADITNTFTDLVSQSFNWGKNLISGFVDGIKSMASAVSNAVSSVIGGVKDFIGFNSPTKKGEGRNIVKWGENMIGGFIDGINNALPELNRTMDQAISNTANYNNTFHISATIREDADINKITQAIDARQRQANRGRGILI